MQRSSFTANFTGWPWDWPSRWDVLRQTPLGRMVQAFLIEWSKVIAANDNRNDHDLAQHWLDYLYFAAEIISSGQTISERDRKLIYEMAWRNRHLIPGDLAVVAALSGGITCDD